MPIYTKLNVHNWFKAYAIFSIELIESFVEGVEKQALESIAKYYEHKKEHILLDVPEENYTRIVTTHQGLDDETFDLKDIFVEYFPSLQRRSALLTIYGIFEGDLDKLCRLYKAEKAFKITLSDLKDKGIDRSASYLKKVVGINVYDTSSEWCHIKEIKKIRNLFAHQDGRLPDDPDKKNSTINYIKQTDSLSKNDDDEVVLGCGFLIHTVKIFKKYFEMINQSINANFA